MLLSLASTFGWAVSTAVRATGKEHDANVVGPSARRGKAHAQSRRIRHAHDETTTDDVGRPGLVCLLGLYVDDVLCIGNPSDTRYQAAKKSLQDSFAFREWQEGET